MADERSRLEIAFEGGQAIAVAVDSAVVDGLTSAIESDEQSFSFEADDGTYTLALRRVVYVKRFARESRTGFGA